MAIKLTPELIRKLTSKYKDGSGKIVRSGCEMAPISLEEYLADAYNNIQRRRNKWLSIQTLYRELEDEHKEEKEKINQQLRELKQECKHEVTKYYPDASGNNDSSTVCQICDKEL